MVLFVLRNEAICCSSVLSTSPLLRATLDVRETMVSDAKREMMVDKGEMREEERGQQTGDEGVQRRTKERRRGEGGRRGVAVIAACRWL